VNPALVMPLRPGTANEQARFALRAWHTHHPDLEPVLIGGAPRWYKGRHLRTEQREGPAYQWTQNFPAAMRATIRHLEGDLWWTADDIFPLEALDPAITYCRAKPLSVYAAQLATRRTHSTYTRLYAAGVLSQARIVAEVAPDVEHNADAHTPHLLNTTRLEELLALFAEDYPEHPAGHFRAVYGALWAGRVDVGADPKVEQTWQVPPRKDMVSLTNATWNHQVGRRLRELFPTPAPWERRA